MELGVSNQFGRPISVDVRPVGDQVEVWVKGRCVGITDRPELSEWLDQAPHERQGEYTHDVVVWMPVGNGVAFGIQDVVPMYPLPDRQVIQLCAEMSAGAASLPRQRQHAQHG